MQNVISLLMLFVILDCFVVIFVAFYVNRQGLVCLVHLVLLVPLVPLALHLQALVVLGHLVLLGKMGLQVSR